MMVPIFTKSAWIIRCFYLFFFCSTAAACQPSNHLQGNQPGDRLLLDSIEFRWCPAGSFQMGSPNTEFGHRNDEQLKEVSLSRGFWLGAYEVTQKQWLTVMGDFPDKPPADQWGLGPDYPLYWVNYAEALRFCQQLTTTWRTAGKIPASWEVHLPTEAQWEYACRAGTSTPTSFGDSLIVAQANFLNGVQAVGKATPAGGYPPNAWGLYDMHGNVFEWCRDWYHHALPGGEDPDLSQRPGTQNRDGTFSRVRRGGAWNDPWIYCRSAFRLRYEPERRSDHIGFRIALVRMN